MGAGGTVLHYNGTSWGPMTSGTGSYLQGVWGTSGADIYAVGQSGTILHYDGGKWVVVAAATAQDLVAVWGTSSSDVYAVGGSGTILHYNGAGWSAMTSGTGQSLLGVWGTSASDMYAVGLSSAILQYNGTSWSPVTVSTIPKLQGLSQVWGTWSSDAYAAGGDSTFSGWILRGVRGATVTITPGSGTVLVGTQFTQQLTATALDANQNVVPGVTFTWSSSDPATVAVNSTGLVTAVGNGSSIITATVTNGTAAGSVTIGAVR